MSKNTMMPSNCHECPFKSYQSDVGQTVCMAKLKWVATGFETIQFEGRPWCPLAEIPEDQKEYAMSNVSGIKKKEVEFGK